MTTTDNNIRRIANFTILMGNKLKKRYFNNLDTYPIDIDVYQKDEGMFNQWIMRVICEKQLAKKKGKWFDLNNLEYVIQAMFEIINEPEDFGCKDMNDIKQLVYTKFAVYTKLI